MEWEDTVPRALCSLSEIRLKADTFSLQAQQFLQTCDEIAVAIMQKLRQELEKSAEVAAGVEARYWQSLQLYYSAKQHYAGVTKLWTERTLHLRLAEKQVEER